MARLPLARIARACAAAVVAAALVGCVLFPKKEDLAQIHDAYRKEFALTFLGDPQGKYTQTADAFCGAGAASGVAFPETLKSIREYEVKYQTDKNRSVEGTHLKILKAMIHLQVGNFGIAKQLAKSLENEPLTASDDQTTRDELFRRALPGLIDGWAKTCAKDLDAASAYELVSAARKIRSALANIKGGAEGGVSTDAGAIYLATTAAIFDRWAFDYLQARCTDLSPARRSYPGMPSPCLDAATYCAAAVRNDGEKSIDESLGLASIGAYLSADELEIAKGGQKLRNSTRADRLRYVAWYGLVYAENTKTDEAVAACPGAKR